MSKSIKGTQTEKNLMISFSGESQARNRYTYYAAAARKEGLVQLSHIFEETAAQEKEVLSKLKDKRYKQYLYDVDFQEQKMMDDIFNAKYIKSLGA